MRIGTPPPGGRVREARPGTKRSWVGPGVLGLAGFVSLWLLWRDPYSHGAGVTENPFELVRVPLQIAVAIVEALLITVGLGCGFTGQRRLASDLVRADLLVHVVANAAYLLRDGSLRLAFGGYSHVPTGWAVIIVGTMTRVLALWILRRR